MTETLGFDTRAIHAGSAPDPATGARQVPIYQTTAYVFRDADHAAKLFGLQEVGYIYSRLTNPTVSALQARVADLEGGAGAVCCSSGHAAQIMALFPLMGPGKNIVASTRLYGGTVTQFSQTIKRFGWSAKFVDLDDAEAVKAAIDDNTQAIFCESISNPGGYLTDIPAIAAIADAAGIPLIVDNTLATPYLCRPIEMGATLVVHSLTKYMTGNGTVTGGVVVDSGMFDWSASGKFPSLSEPEPAYHGLKFHEALGAGSSRKPGAFSRRRLPARSRAKGSRAASSSGSSGVGSVMPLFSAWPGGRRHVSAMQFRPRCASSSPSRAPAARG